MIIRPQFLILTTAECQRVLGRSRVGRLAFLNAGSVDIEPIGYVARDNWIFFRSAYGAKLEALAHSPYAAFEVDEVRGPEDWISVVAHGTTYLLPADGGPVERRAFARAVAALRRVAPETLTSDDPTPHRDTIYGLHVDRISGRTGQPASAPRRGRKVQPNRATPSRRDGMTGS
jgi:nitroimidazol reductase NimA-like FMN-containing flavoprotein (pyridoxamine 5'-phosphate oxidase superfamily)